jgi:hypothetical protein
MGFQWKELSPSAQQQLEQAIQQTNYFYHAALSQFLRGSQRMNYSWMNNKKTEKDVLALISRSFEDRLLLPQGDSKRSYANVLSMLGELQIHWVDIPKETQDTLHNAFKKLFPLFTDAELDEINKG